MTTNLSPMDPERLSAWLDGELPPEQAEEVARLVETDPAWAEAYRRLKALDRVLDLWTVPPPPADLARRVWAHRRSRRESVVLRVGQWMLSAAALALIAGGLWLHFARQQSLSRPLNPALVRSGFSAVPETFLRDNVELFHHMPDKIPAGGPVRFVLYPASGPSTQPAIRLPSWGELTPRQQQKIRRRAVIFLRLSPEQQMQLLQAHEAAMREARLQQQRLNWLKVVLESFTPAQRQALLQMTPAQRGRAFLERREELRRAGKLPPNESSFLPSPSPSFSPEP